MEAHPADDLIPRDLIRGKARAVAIAKNWANATHGRTYVTPATEPGCADCFRVSCDYQPKAVAHADPQLWEEGA